MKYQSERIGKKVDNDIDHLMQCSVCKQIFDMRNLEEVMEHEHKS